MKINQTTGGQQELTHQPTSSEIEESGEEVAPIENQIVGYNEALDQYVLKSAGETIYVDSSELFNKVSNGEKVFVEGVKDSIPGFSITYQEGDDVFIKEDILVEQITVADLKKKMTQIYNTTESMDLFI